MTGDAPAVSAHALCQILDETAADPGLFRDLAAVRGDRIHEPVASCFARVADQQLRAGRNSRRHDTWIAATAMRHHAAVLTQDADFGVFGAIEVIRV